jgi:hypothetical protein
LLSNVGKSWVSIELNTIKLSEFGLNSKKYGSFTNHTKPHEQREKGEQQAGLASLHSSSCWKQLDSARRGFAMRKQIKNNKK